MEQIPELYGLAAQFIETGNQFVCRFIGIFPLCCIIVAPGAGNALPVRLFQRPVAPRYGPFRDAPRDQELHHPFFSGFQRKMCCQIAVVIIPAPGGALFIHAVCPGRERLAAGQLVEIHFQSIGPAAAIPVCLTGNIGRIFQQGQDKLIFLAVGHGQAGAAAADRIRMPFLFPRVLDHADRRCLHGCAADIFKGILQHGAGQRRFPVHPRNERTPRGQFCSDGKLLFFAGKSHFRHGKSAVESVIPEVWQPRQQVGFRSPAKAPVGVGRSLPVLPGVRLEAVSLKQTVLSSGADTEMSSAENGVFIRLIEDLPVAQSAVSGESDTSGTDPAQRERDLLCFFLIVKHKKVLCFLRICVLP